MSAGGSPLASMARSRSVAGERATRVPSDRTSPGTLERRGRPAGQRPGHHAAEQDDDGEAEDDEGRRPDRHRLVARRPGRRRRPLGALRAPRRAGSDVVTMAAMLPADRAGTPPAAPAESAGRPEAAAGGGSGPVRAARGPPPPGTTPRRRPPSTPGSPTGTGAAGGGRPGRSPWRRRRRPCRPVPPRGGPRRRPPRGPAASRSRGPGRARPWPGPAAGRRRPAGAVADPGRVMRVGATSAVQPMPIRPRATSWARRRGNGGRHGVDGTRPAAGRPTAAVRRRPAPRSLDRNTTQSGESPRLGKTVHVLFTLGSRSLTMRSVDDAVAVIRGRALGSAGSDRSYLQYTGDSGGRQRPGREARPLARPGRSARRRGRPGDPPSGPDQPERVQGSVAPAEVPARPPRPGPGGRTPWPGRPPSGTSSPVASRAAVADARLQPVPWLFRVTTRSCSRTVHVGAVEEDVGHPVGRRAPAGAVDARAGARP